MSNNRTAVCIIIENLPAPMDRRVWREATALRDAGYLVSIICPKGTRSCTASHELLDGITIYRHPAFEASSPVGYLLEYAWAFIAEVYLVAKVFALTRFRILQACNPPDTICIIGLFLKLFGVRFIFDHHDLGPELFQAKFGANKSFFYTLTRIAEQLSFKAATVSIANNDSFREIAVTRGGIPKERVFVVRNCPDLAKSSRRPPRLDIKAGKSLLVTYVGFMGSQDGLPLLLDSIEHIVSHDRREDTHFLLIGGGPMLSDLRASAVRKGLSDFVTFTGIVPHEEVLAYLSTSDIGVSPDPKNPMNDNSTMVKVFEYMASGLPTVLFDLKEGHRIAGASALYAVPNDPGDFADQITRLLDSKELRHRLGECGRQRVEEIFNWENERKVLLKAYDAALSAQPAL